MASSDKELEEQLLEAGNKLLEPPSAEDELLPLLEQIENCLSRVEQAPSKSMQNALSPLLKALVANQLVRHTNFDVKVAVASCISEITRITAPEAPYNDDQMKEVFQLIVSSFDNISDKSSRSYARKASILETVAKVRSCVVMLDLECDELILQMFRHFFKSIRNDYPENAFSSMETIMTLVLEESEDISAELLSPILASLKRSDEEVLPIARKLGERVLENCSTKLKPYLIQAVKTFGISLDDYSNVVASICQDTSVSTEHNVLPASEHSAEESKSVRMPADGETQAQAVDEGQPTAVDSSKQVDPAVDKCAKSITSNGTAEASEDDSMEDLKNNNEEGHTADQIEGISTRNSDPDNLGIKEVIKPEQTTKTRGMQSNSLLKLTEPDKESGSCPGEHDPSSTCVVPSAEALPSENEREAEVGPSSPKALEKESVNVPSPSLSGNLSDESHSKKRGRTKKTEDLVDKEATQSVEDVSNKVSERKNYLKVKLNRHSEKDPTGISDENLSDESYSRKNGRTKMNEESDKEATQSVEDGAKKVTGGTNDLKVKLNWKSERKASTATSDDNLCDESHSKKTGRTKKNKDTDKEATQSVEDVSKKVSEGTNDLKVKLNRRSEKKAHTGMSNENLSDESHSKKAGQTKKTEDLDKEDTQSVEDVLKKVSEGTNDLIVKLHRRPGKKAPTEISNENKTAVAENVSEKKVDTTSDSKEKTSRHSAKKVDRSSKNGGKPHLKQSEDKKWQGQGNVISGKDVLKSSTKDDKKTPKSSTKDDRKEVLASPVQADKDGHDSEESPKTNSKRKRTPGKEKESEEDFSENLVGSKIKVWWPKDRMFYEGAVDSFDPAKKKHKVLYTDGDEEILNLKRERWELTEGSPGPELGQKTDKGGADASSDRRQKKKAKLNSNEPAKRGKTDASSKRDGIASSSKSKVITKKSGVNSKDRSKFEGKKSKDDTSKSAGKSVDDNSSKKSKDHPSKSGNTKSADKAPKTSSKLKNDVVDTPKTSKAKDDEAITPKGSTKSKQDTPKPGKSKQETVKTSSITRDKPPQSDGKSNVNGTSKSKSGSSKAKGSGDLKDDKPTDSEKLIELVKGKSSTSSKAKENESKSGKKRRRGVNS